MKRNINLLVLTLEIAAIVVLHIVKMNHATVNGPALIDATATKSRPVSPSVVKQYSLVSIK